MTAQSTLLMGAARLLSLSVLPLQAVGMGGVGLLGNLDAVAATSTPLPLAQTHLGSLEDAAYWRNLCQLRAADRQYEAALQACASALEIDPGDVDTWLRHSNLLLQTEQYPEAVASAIEATKLQSDHSLALTYQCMGQYEMGQSEAALSACSQALEADRHWDEQSADLARLYHTRALVQQGDYETAQTTYDLLLRDAPDQSQVLTYQCEASVAQSDYEAALDQCQAALAGDSHWSWGDAALAWYLQGLAHQGLGDDAAAVEAFDAAIRLNANDADIWLAEGESLVALNREAEALLAYNRAVKLRPDSSQALVGQCSALNAAQQYEAALNACQTALSGDGDWGNWDAAVAWSEQGQALAGQGDYRAALAAVDRAVGLNPNYAEAWNNRGVIYWYQRDYRNAIASLQKAAEANPNYAQPWANLGRMMRALGQYDRAVAAYDRAIELAPEDAGIWASRSVVLWQQQNYAAALAAADKAIELNPTSYQGWYNRGTTLVALENYEDALTAYEQALTLQPSSADAWTGLGLTLSNLERYNEARGALSRAVNLNPQQMVAQQALRSLPDSR